MDKKLTVKESFSDLIEECLSENDNTYFIGFDVQRHGIKPSQHEDHIINMPICEETIMGVAVGLSRCGCMVFVDLMLEAFVYRTFDVFFNQISLSEISPFNNSYAPIIVRMHSGTSDGAGIQHGSNPLSILIRIPNILISIPLTSSDLDWVYKYSCINKILFVLLYDFSNIESLVSRMFFLNGKYYQLGEGRRICIFSVPNNLSLISRYLNKPITTLRIIVPIFFNKKFLLEIFEDNYDVEEFFVIDYDNILFTLINEYFQKEGFMKKLNFINIFSNGSSKVIQEEQLIVMLNSILKYE
ncbi:MAG: hypothetical protein HXX09_10955 [Bacteroidetes bacterium]|nr:hypothetical protein [Bacteroidota bacterium]